MLSAGHLGELQGCSVATLETLEEDPLPARGAVASAECGIAGNHRGTSLLSTEKGCGPLVAAST